MTPRARVGGCKTSMFKCKARRFSAGFTLLEIMVAMAIFGIAAVALVKTIGGSARNLEELELRQFAGIVAHNRMVEVEVTGLRGNSQGNIDLAGREYRWRQISMETPDPAISRIEIRVGLPGEDASLVERVMFVPSGRQ